MSTAGWLPAPAEELFGPDATAGESYEVLTVDVPPGSWTDALRTARDELGCTYFDWLSAVDEPGEGFRIAAHVVALGPVRRLLLRTTVPHEAPALASAVDVYAGAAWHERETHEMFGVTFEGHPGLDHLLLPDTFEGHPLRKDFVLAARVAKAWPGAKEPGEQAAGPGHGGPKRRQMLPPGVPDPNEWGPLKGQLPPAPARPARGTTAAGRPGAGRAAAGERPPRRTRTAAEGSASQAGAPGRGAPESNQNQGKNEGQGNQDRGQGTGAAGSTGRSGAEGAAPRSARPPAAPRSADAPWHHSRPAFEEPRPEPDRGPEPERKPESEKGPEPERKPEIEKGSKADRKPEASETSDTPAPAPAPTPEAEADPGGTEGPGTPDTPTGGEQ
ncbi:NADH-quinone oxidoreductase subunit C [Streptomyces sp. bgisy153]|uniref:NADH-quinone oxidoreductase subunit C n=1 Tax=Streptomyces sp. bgisy153 TaxID=3413793 RepID=UPI003D70F21B